MLVKILVLAAAVISTSAWASSEQKVCARIDSVGAKSYAVNATVASGSELNNATNSIRFDAFAEYVVIFWELGQASIIRIDFGSLTPYGSSGTDQQGRHWRVSSDAVFCV